MELQDIIFTALISSGFCLGLWTALDEGALLHFLQKPFIDHANRVHQWQRDEFKNIGDNHIKRISEINKSWKNVSDYHLSEEYKTDIKAANKATEMQYAEITRSMNMQLFYQWLLKPILLCGRCFASVWGTVVYVQLWGENPLELKFVLLNIMITASINAIILNRYYYAE